MNTTYLRCGLALAGLLSCAGCRENRHDLGAEVVMPIALDVSSDPGKGTKGADIQAGGRTLATTDDAGHAALQLHGIEGDLVELTVACPAGFEAPAASLKVAIRRGTEGEPGPHFDARCAPMVRTVVVGVRTEHGPDLPVVYLGREVARTDSSGAALVALSVKPGEHVSLTLDTDAVRAGQKLAPENPTLTFVARDADDFVTLDQKFAVEKPRPKPSRRVPRPSGPTRI